MANPESGLHQAGRILVLVGAIMNFVGALFVVIAALGIVVMQNVTDGGNVVTSFIGIMYGVLALVSIAGGIVGITAYHRAKAGEVHSAWIRGLVAALLPPVQAITLVGAILLLTSPEHEAWKAGQGLPQMPP